MRVLFVNDKCGYFGGVEQNVVDAAIGLRGRGHECSLAFLSPATGQADYQAHFDRTWDLSTVAFEQVVAEAQPDVVYFHKISPLPPLPPGVRTVRMVHDHDLCCPRQHKYFTFSGRICRHRADWRCWLDLAFLQRDRQSRAGVRFKNICGTLAEMQRNRSVDLLLVGSRFMRDELCGNGFADDHVRILPPLISMAGAAPAAASAGPNVLYVGQLIRGKGVDLLLDALSRVRVPWEATIIGAGNARASLDRLCANLGLAGRVNFVGWVPHEDLPAYYAAAAVVAVPSRWPEPFGLVGLEAMRAAKPVVAFDVGGIGDWLTRGETGLLVPEQDTAAMARALGWLLRDAKLARRMGEAGLQRATEQFAFCDYLDRLEQHLTGARAVDRPREATCELA